MNEYKYSAETVPDPIVGEGYYMFPVRQYFNGAGKRIYPPEWAEQELQIKRPASVTQSSSPDTSM